MFIVRDVSLIKLFMVSLLFVVFEQINIMMMTTMMMIQKDISLILKCMCRHVGLHIATLVCTTLLI